MHPIFLRSNSVLNEVDKIKFKTLKDVKEVYGEDNLVKIVNIKQILFYAKNGLQPVFIEEGYKGKLVAYFHKPSTMMLWKYWLESRPNNKEVKDYEEN